VSRVLELVQPFVTRCGEWLDLPANAMGVLSGAVIGMVINFFTSGKTQFKTNKV